MRTRAEAVALIREQLHEDYDPPITEKGCWHYGRYELRKLLDFIYDGEPKSDNEKII